MKPYTQNRLPLDAIYIVAPEFVLIPVEEGYILDGGQQTELVSGPMALSSLPVILPLIDGIRSLSQISDASPHVTTSDLEKAVQQLLSWGVLYLRQELSARVPQMRNTLSSLKRGDSGISLDAALEVLANTVVSIVCDEVSRGSAHEIAEALKQNGFCHVHAYANIEITSAASSKPLFVISLVNEESSSLALEDHYAKVLSIGCRWIRASLGSHSAEIGPVFTADTNLCLPCLSKERSGNGLTSSGPCQIDQVAWPAILASEVTALLLSSSYASRAFRRYCSPFFASEVRTWPATGFCVRNHEALVIERQPTTEYLPLLYEEAIASRQEISDASVDSDPASPISPKKMLSSVSTPLPSIRLELSQRVFSLLMSAQRERVRPVTLEIVTQLLALSVGVRAVSGNVIQRWSPSGGNLGSTEAYLVAIEVDGLAPGVYFYKPEEHILKRLNQLTMDHLEAACSAVHLGHNAAAMVIFSGAYRRIARKYGPFAYKLSHLDGGVASSQFLITASAREVKVTNAQSWDSETLGQALALRSQEEVPIQVFCLNSGRASIASSQECGDRAMHDGSPLQTHMLTGLSDPSPEELVSQLVYLSRLVQGRLPARMVPNRPLSLKHCHDSAFAAVRSQVALGEALNRRSSQRLFSDKGINLLEIKLFLRSALDNNVFKPSQLSVSILVQRSDSCSPGIYWLKPDTMSLVRKREAFTREQVEDLFLTRGYGGTPLIIWISGRVHPTAGATRNTGEYQTLLLRAGLLGHRLWMAALGLGMEGSLIAGIRSGAARRSEKFMQDGDVSLLAFICGYPLQDKDTEVRKA